MAYDKFLIAPINSGLQTDLQPWLIPDQAYASLNNAYIFRGRVRKRFGSTYMLNNQLDSRLTVPLSGGAAVGITDGAGDAAGDAPGNIFALGQLFSIGTELYTVNALGNPAALLSTGAGAGTYDTTTGAYTFAGSPALTQIYFYPALPVMGIDQYEIGAVNNNPTFAFDTQFAYIFAGGFWAQSDATLWHGDDSQFFWTATWSGITANLKAFFASNFNATIGVPGIDDDPIRWWNGSAWTDFTPQFLTAGDKVATARIVIPFKNRLILLNTIETNAAGNLNTAYVNRCRFSQNGSPIQSPGIMVGTTSNIGAAAGNVPTGPFRVGQYFVIGNSRYVSVLSGVAQALMVFGIGTGTFSTTNGAFTFAGAPANTDIFFFRASPFLEITQVGSPGGGFIDATTEEAIISAEFIKDRLIVYFERSTWELAYTGNEVLPFVWQKINTELGSESELSTVPFDKIILTIGNTGVHACNGANVQRTDNLIPDEIFQIQNSDQGNTRVAGIRDYYTEMVYWTLPSIARPTADTSSTNSPYPNRVLVYNYQNATWAYNDDCITAFGYFEQQGDMTWANTDTTWQEFSGTWTSGLTQSEFRQVLAGNQQGFVYRVVPDFNANEHVMQLTDMTNFFNTLVMKIINHTLINGEFIHIQNAQGVTFPDTNNIYKVVVLDKDTIFVNDLNVVGVYLGGGTVSRVSNINILTKQWNFYNDKDQNVFIPKVDFNVTKTTDGEITVDYYPSSTSLSMIEEGTATGALLGTNVLETAPYPLIPLESIQERLWHPVYFQTSGMTVQLAFGFSDAQIMDPDIAFSQFELNGLVVYAAPVGRMQ